jgi:hypothetical protein
LIPSSEKKALNNLQKNLRKNKKKLFKDKLLDNLINPDFKVLIF